MHFRRSTRLVCDHGALAIGVVVLLASLVAGAIAAVVFTRSRDGRLGQVRQDDAPLEY